MATLDRTDEAAQTTISQRALDLYYEHRRLPRRRPRRHRFPSAQWMRRVPLPWRIMLVFVTLIAISNVALDKLGSGLAQTSDGWGALNQIAACEHQSMTPNIVVMGSSHAQAGIAPPVLDGEVAARLDKPIITCNVGVTTSVPMQDNYMLRRLIDDGVRPKFIIYVASDYAFNSPIAEQNQPVLENLEYLTNLSDLPAIANTTVGKQSIDKVPWAMDFAEGQLVRLYADRQGIQDALCQIKPDFGPCPDLLPSPAYPVASPDTPLRVYPIDKAQGWYPLPEATTKSLLNSQYQYKSWLRNYQVSPDALHYLGRLVDLARSYHIGMIMINMPVLPRQLAFYPQVGDYVTYLDALYQFSHDHSVPFYDEGLGWDDDINDFADTNHLNYWGALAFTGWLGVHAVVPEYQRQVLGQR
jgi:hypothetical protein